MGFFRSLFGSEPIPAKPLPPISLATDALAALGLHDSMRAEFIQDIRNLRAEAVAERDGLDRAISAMDEHLAREELAYGAPDADAIDQPAGHVLLTVSHDTQDEAKVIANLMPVDLAPTASRKAKRPAPELEAAE